MSQILYRSVWRHSSSEEQKAQFKPPTLRHGFSSRSPTNVPNSQFLQTSGTSCRTDTRMYAFKSRTTSTAAPLHRELPRDVTEVLPNPTTYSRSLSQGLNVSRFLQFVLKNLFSQSRTVNSGMKHSSFCRQGNTIERCRVRKQRLLCSVTFPAGFGKGSHQ